MVPTVPSNYWIYLLAAIFGPLQGFLNALVVFCRDRKSIQRWVSRSTRKLLSQRSTKSTNIGSSEVVCAVLAVGKDAKQPNEEAAQLEICADHLVRLEEEGKTPEAALDGEGNISNEALGKTDEGLLEHAMNSGLLNDDDLELYRAGIARIQRRTSSFVVQ